MRAGRAASRGGARGSPRRCRRPPRPPPPPSTPRRGAAPGGGRPQQTRGRPHVWHARVPAARWLACMCTATDEQHRRSVSPLRYRNLYYVGWVVREQLEGKSAHEGARDSLQPRSSRRRRSSSSYRLDLGRVVCDRPSPPQRLPTVTRPPPSSSAGSTSSRRAPCAARRPPLLALPRVSPHVVPCGEPAPAGARRLQAHPRRAVRLRLSRSQRARVGLQ